MNKFPRITAKKLISLLKTHGFYVDRVKGSHYFLKHDDNRCTVIPVHSGEVIGIGLLQKILKDCEVTKEQLKKSNN